MRFISLKSFILIQFSTMLIQKSMLSHCSLCSAPFLASHSPHLHGHTFKKKCLSNMSKFFTTIFIIRHILNIFFDHPPVLIETTLKKAKNISNGAAEAPQSLLRKLDNGSHQRKAKQIPKMISFSLLSFLRILAVSMDYAPDIRSVASHASYVRSRLFVLTKPERQRRQYIWRLNLPYMECG